MKRVVVVACVVATLLFVAIGGSAQEDAWIPGLASFVIPGLGQLLNDQLDRALVHFGVSIAIWTVGFYSAIFLPPMAIATPALALGWHIYSAYDAYTIADETNFTIGFVENGIGFAYNF